MRKGLSVAFLCAAALPAAAQTALPGAAEHPHEQHAGEASPAQGAPAPEMQGMHEHMQLMQEQMARIHAAQDPDEKQRLMHEHMQSMQQHMAMMGRMPASAGTGGPGAATCAQADMACRMNELQAQHGMMQQRMGAMQQLMQQMMQHLSESTGDDDSATGR